MKPKTAPTSEETSGQHYCSTGVHITRGYNSPSGSDVTGDYVPDGLDDFMGGVMVFILHRERRDRNRERVTK